MPEAWDREMRAKTRIIVADDHALFREGLELVLACHAEVKVVAEVQRVDDLLPTLARTPCDVLLLDLRMDRDAVGEIGALAAHAAVVVLTGIEAPDVALAAMRAGARGVVFKRDAAEVLMQAVRAVMAGQVWMPQSVQRQLAIDPRAPALGLLTPREREIVRHVALGLRNAEVARELDISEQTIKTHLNNIFHKLGVRDRVELALYAAREGIIGVHERSRPSKVPGRRKTSASVKKPRSGG